jgi:hypothetical protein
MCILHKKQIKEHISIALMQATSYCMLLRFNAITANNKLISSTNLIRELMLYTKVLSK